MGPANKKPHLKLSSIIEIYLALLLFVVARVTKKYQERSKTLLFLNPEHWTLPPQNSVAASKKLMIFDLVNNFNVLSEGVLT